MSGKAIGEETLPPRVDQETTSPSAGPPGQRSAPKGRTFEAFEPGMVLKHKWGRTLTRDEAIRFATQTMNYNPLWFNLEYAKDEGHPDIVVCPWLVFNIVLGMSVEEISEHATALLGYGDMTFHRDVYPGDTITATSEVLEVRPSGSKPDQGIVKVRTTAVDQEGAVILTYERANLIKRGGGP